MFFFKLVCFLYVVGDISSYGLSRGGEGIERRAVLKAGLTISLSPSLGRAAELEFPQLEGESRPKLSRLDLETILPPVLNRATTRYDLGKGAYAFEQLLLFANVSATIRMNVQKLEDNTLLVFSPVGITQELLQLLAELEAPVAHIVLPVTALEHKFFVGPFVRNFPKAKLWLAPGNQAGFPVGRSQPDGIFSNGTPLPDFPMQFKTFYVDLPGNSAPVAETAFFYEATQTLFLTDAVVFVPDRPPNLFSTVLDTSLPDFWPKSVLQAFFLALRQDEKGNWPAYDKLQNRLIRAPILRAFADARAPEETRAWVNDIASSWKFNRIITSHFSSPILATPAEFKHAFAYLEQTNPGASSLLKSSNILRFDDADWKPLDDLNTFIAQNKLGAPIKADFK